MRDSGKAHEMGLYTLEIPVMLAQVDGMVTARVGRNLFARWRDKHKAQIREMLGDRDVAVPYVDALVDVDGCILNRHAILHGEIVDYGTEDVSLKTVSLSQLHLLGFGDGGILWPDDEETQSAHADPEEPPPSAIG